MDEKIDEILTRGVENIFPNKEFVKEKISKEKIRIYFGVDPTGPTLHLGHIIPLRRLAEFQKLGHQIIFLIGDFTGMIGDPTDKTATRKKLTREEVLKNCALYKKQASKFISFEGENKAEFRFNSEWMDKLSYLESLEIASLFTVDQLLKRDMFRRREDEGRPVYLHEIQYPMMQGYDSVMLDADGEIGGNDQTFNMLAGRDLTRQLKNKEKFVITMKLLVDTSGKKMGKTENNMITLDQNPEDIFGKVMSWPDSLIVPGFEIVTDVSMDEVEKIKSGIESADNPRDYKIMLAREIVRILCGEKVAEKAQENFENIFSKKEFPEDAKVIIAVKDQKLADVVVENKIIESKTEFRRLIEAGAVSDFPNKTVTDPGETVGDTERKIKIGKKTFVILRPK